MLKFLKKLLTISKQETKPQRETYHPPASELAILDEEELKYENRVIDFLNKKKPYGNSLVIDPDTGMFMHGDVRSKNHWTEFSEFAPYARAILVRTTNWNEKTKQIACDSIGTTFETVGTKKIRFYVPFETQFDFLENKNENHLLMFERDVIHQFSLFVRVVNPYEIGILNPSPYSLYLQYAGAIYWNRNFSNLSPVEEALVKDYAYFEFHSENPNNENSHD